ncbi:GMC oxidoreductase [Pseudochelatococcus sp. B33]
MIKRCIRFSCLAIEQARELAHAPEMRDFNKREILPGKLGRADMVEFIRNSVVTYFHMSGTAKMGVDGDDTAVVDSYQSVRGVRNLSIADTSIFPDIPRANTMVPAVVAGYQLAHHLLSKR